MPKSDRGAATREAIAEAARDLFLEVGYQATTMRAVAQRAGVSQGNAYYYFASKEELAQSLYESIQQAHALAVAPVLEGCSSFRSRLEGSLIAWVDVAEPYHGFAGTFFKVAAEPTSPLSPFSDQSRLPREHSIELMAGVLDGSDLKVPPALRAELPELLWLLQMGMVLFWVHDQSQGQRRTRALIAQVVPLIDRLIRLTRIPGVRGVAEDIVRIVRSLAP